MKKISIFIVTFGLIMVASIATFQAVDINSTDKKTETTTNVTETQKATSEVDESKNTKETDPNSDISLLESSGVELKNTTVSEGKNDSGLDTNNIHSIKSGFIRTNGGKNDTDVMYSSIEDATAKSNPVPISGAGFDGIYVNSISKENKIYVEFIISGSVFYMLEEDVTLVSTEEAKAISHYENINGVWTYFQAVDILNSDEYETYELGEAPKNTQSGLAYYTLDEENFYTSPQQVINTLSKRSTRAATLSGVTYFQNLPLNSASKYSAANYKSYLAKVGATSSKYYNSTQSFINAQNQRGINSLMLFAIANHEGYYGMSNLSKTCNNFFGLGAYDSNPNNACVAYNFNTPNDGILGESIFLQQSFFDVKDWRFNGNHPGNKASGINVYYASDPNWGKAVGNMAYNVDKYLGSKDNSVYTIGSVKNADVYVNASRTNNLKVKAGSGSASPVNYNIKQTAGTSSSSSYGVKVILTKSEGSSYQIQLPTPINNNEACSAIKVEGGSYPNYKGSTNTNTPNGVANYSCNYTFSKDLGYISKSGVTILNTGNYTAPSVISPSDTISKFEYYSTGEVSYEFVLDKNSNIKYAIHFDKKGNTLQYLEYISGTKYGEHSGLKMTYIYEIENGVIKYAKQQSYNVILRYYEYKNGTKYGSHGGSTLTYVFDVNENNILTKTSQLKDGKTIRHYEYFEGTKYGEQSGSKMTAIIDVDNNDYIIRRGNYVNGATTKYLEYEKGTKYKEENNFKITYIFDIATNGTILKTTQQNQNKIVRYYEYKVGTKYGEHGGSTLTYVFDVKENDVLTKTAQLQDGKTIKYYEYLEDTKYKEHSGSKMTSVIDIDNNSNIIRKSVLNNGTITKYLEYEKGTKYEEGSDLKITYMFDVNKNGIILKTTQLKNNIILRYYEYNIGTKYGEHGGKSLTYVFDVDSNNVVTKGAQLKDGKNVKYYTYESNVKYGEHGGSNLKNVYTIANGSINISQELSKGKVLKNIEYNSGTNLSNLKEKMKFEAINNNNGYIDVAFSYKNGKRNMKFEYPQNSVKYGKHSNKYINVIVL